MAKIKSEKSVLEWCRQQVIDGRELKLCWEGGGDSGWTYFQIDGQTVENTFTEKLTDMMYAELDYGSWAGEFSAQGEAIFDAYTEAFVGTDYYSETTNISIEADIKVSIPKEIWFDRIRINVDVQEDENNVEVSFIVLNGFVTPQHTVLEESLKTYILDEVIDTIDSKNLNNFRSAWDNIIINHSEFTENGDSITYTIDKLSISVEEQTDKSIYLSISENE
jgi:hypothetical protein